LRDSVFLQNIGELPDYTASHPVRLIASFDFDTCFSDVSFPDNFILLGFPFVLGKLELGISITPLSTFLTFLASLAPAVTHRNTSRESVVALSARHVQESRLLHRRTCPSGHVGSIIRK
jgi:hypothetical protein